MFYLKRNLPTLERAVRLGLGAGVALLTHGLASGGLPLTIGYLASATLIGTAIGGFCPACALFGRKPVAGR